jgi:hypothetical protein
LLPTASTELRALTHGTIFHPPPRTHCEHQSSSSATAFGPARVRQKLVLQETCLSLTSTLHAARSAPDCKKRGVATICPNGELKGGKGKRLILADTEELHARISALESALHESHAQLTRAGGVGVGSSSSGGEASREGAGTTHPLLDSSFHYEPLDGGSSAGAGEDHAAEGAGASGSGSRLAGGPGGAKGKGRELLNPAERGVGEDNIGRLSAGRFFGGSAGSAYLLVRPATSSSG